MTDYAKITLDAVVSENADYSNPRSKLQTTQTFTPSAYVHQKVNVLTTGFTLLDFIPYNFASVDSIIIHNPDTVNYISVKWFALVHNTATITNPGGTGFTFTGSDGSILDNTSGSKFTNVAVNDYLHNNNATHSSNISKAMLVTNVVSAHKVIVNTSLTDSANDTAVTFTIVRENQQRVPPGGILTLPGNMLTDVLSGAGNEMQLIADTKTTACNLIFLGT
tara:strand:+ start:786 stop:1448 length:663 start_codon:yes stop_codon:yes gene_type:complete